MKIREATWEDVKFIVNLNNKLNEYHVQYDDIYKLKNNLEERLESSTQHFEKMITSEDSLIFVAEEKGIIIGYVAGRLQKIPPIREITEIGYLSSIYVSKEYREQEIGKKLTEKMIEGFKEQGIKYIELSVDCKNQIAYDFWKAIGFKTRRLVMKRPL